MTGELTCSVVDALAPGLSVSVEVVKVAVQPGGTVLCRLKVAAAQLGLSLLVTETEKDTGLPGCTHWLWDGVRVTVGLAGAQGGAVKLTETVAPALLTDRGAMVTPASGS